jgi:[ribosomal protein S5]-alanine N-acetyltransferase
MRIPVLSTPRLRLDELEEADAPFILELLTDPDFLRQIGERGLRDPAGARRYAREAAAAVQP